MSTGRLFLVVFAAVLLANVATLAILDVWMGYQADTLAVTLNAETERLFSDQRRSGQGHGASCQATVERPGAGRTGTT